MVVERAGGPEHFRPAAVAGTASASAGRASTKLTRSGRNLAVAGVGAIVLQLTESPVGLSLRALANSTIWACSSGCLAFMAGGGARIILLDYVLTHKVPLLWRFHVAHHVDLDLDASTALRFKFGELNMEQMMEAIHMASALRGGAALIHGLQAHSSVNKVSM